MFKSSSLFDEKERNLNMFHSSPQMRRPSFLQDELLKLDMEIDQLRWESCRELAEELVLDRGWKKDDDDFVYQVEEEARRLEDEELERYRQKRGPTEQEMREIETCNSDQPCL